MRTFNSMTDSVLARHGIGKQVLSAQIVRKANEKLLSMIPPEIARDMRVLSFKDKELTIACQNPAARYEAESLMEALAKSLEEEFPSVTIHCVAKLRPEAFVELY